MVIEGLDPPAADLEGADLTAEHRPGLDEGDLVPRLRQFPGGGESTDAAADDDRAH